MSPMLVRIFDESAIPCNHRISSILLWRGGGTYGKEIERFVEVFLVICFECTGPGLEFGFERHYGGECVAKGAFIRSQDVPDVE